MRANKVGRQSEFSVIQLPGSQNGGCKLQPEAALGVTPVWNTSGSEDRYAMP